MNNDDTYQLDLDDDTYEPYIPVAQRRQAKLAKLSTLGINASKTAAKQAQEALDEIEDAQREEETRREKARKERTLLAEAQEVHSKKAAEGESALRDRAYRTSKPLPDRFEKDGDRKGRRGRR